MSRYSEYLERKKYNSILRFFGEGIEFDNGYVKSFKHYKSDQEVIIITNNVIMINETPVLILGNNKGHYLKWFNIKKLKKFNSTITSYAIKINKEFFKIYEFKNNFEDFYFDNDVSFEDLIEIAKEQDKNQIKWSVL